MKNWQDEANCRGTDPESWSENDRETHAVLARICANCPVIEHCYTAALAEGEAWSYRAGLWFGPVNELEETESGWTKRQQRAQAEGQRRKYHHLAA